MTLGEPRLALTDFRRCAALAWKENILAAQPFRPLADNIYRTDGKVHLIGGRDVATGKLSFPSAPGTDSFPISNEGTLWSWTVQRFRPKSPPYAGPERFEPYAVGYVEFPGQLIVEGRLTNVDFDSIRIGMVMRTVEIPFSADADGTIVMTYAFEPVKED